MIVDMISSEEQRMIEDSLRGFLRERLPIERLRDPAAHGGKAEDAAWSGLAELGLFGLGLAEEQGGLGYGTAEEAQVARALGAFLVSPSVLAQVVAPHFASDEGLREAIVAGDARAAFAATDGHAIDAAGASHLLVLSDDGAALNAVEFGEAVEGLDETLKLHRYDGVPASPSDGTRVSLMLAAYLTGIAQAATQMAVAYAREREQFGQPIGSFQAIKHMCADMRVRADAADTQTFYAAITGVRAESPACEAAAARMLANEAALENAKANIQLHGGMGFTAECDAHLLLKRAQVIARFGTSAARLRRDLLAP